MDPAEPVRFQPGDRVRVRVGNPPTHYRTPRYVQGKRGRIDISHPNTKAVLVIEEPQPNPPDEAPQLAVGFVLAALAAVALLRRRSR